MPFPEKVERPAGVLSNREDVTAYIEYLEQVNESLNDQNHTLFNLCEVVKNELMDQLRVVEDHVDPEVREQIQHISEKFNDVLDGGNGKSRPIKPGD